MTTNPDLGQRVRDSLAEHSSVILSIKRVKRWGMAVMAYTGSGALLGWLRYWAGRDGAVLRLVRR